MPTNTENIEKQLDKKLYNWWRNLSQRNIITIYKIEELLQIKDLPAYLLENYKKYFEKSRLNGDKDYTFRALIDDA